MKTADGRVRISQKCEQETQRPKPRIRLSMAHLLFNLCNALKQPKKKQRKVHGHRSYQRLEDIRQFRAVLVEGKKANKRKEK